MVLRRKSKFRRVKLARKRGPDDPELAQLLLTRVKRDRAISENGATEKGVAKLDEEIQEHTMNINKLEVETRSNDEKSKILEERLAPKRERGVVAMMAKAAFHQRVEVCHMVQEKAQSIEDLGGALYLGYQNVVSENIALRKTRGELTTRRKELLVQRKNWNKTVPALFPIIDYVARFVPVTNSTQVLRQQLSELNDPKIREQLIGRSRENEDMAKEIERLVNARPKTKSAPTTTAEDTQKIDAEIMECLETVPDGKRKETTKMRLSLMKPSQKKAWLRKKKQQLAKKDAEREASSKSPCFSHSAGDLMSPRPVTTMKRKPPQKNARGPSTAKD